MRLSPHFTLDELTRSEWAARHGVSNDPSPAQLQNLRFLADRLEEVRALLGVPMQVTSGFRAEHVNAGVGGSPHSQHRDGLACDFVAPQAGTPYEVARAIAASDLPFDQLIHEFGRWVHISFVPDRPPRREALSIFKAGQYLSGIREQ